MGAADRGDLDDLPVDHLDPVLGRQDVGVGHAVVGLDVEAAAGRGFGAVEGGLHQPGTPIHCPQSNRTGSNATVPSQPASGTLGPQWLPATACATSRAARMPSEAPPSMKPWKSCEQCSPAKWIAPWGTPS